eukprot:TRINITY_DN3971_c0_g1_i1.p1 TRINITY_DN3971_c0_g1~~TRINITY_DN3971_c0_g1_i1.p1  ORF type:complete len:415 (-),score=69.38 TRINITY_DN3971_c0_g1_i1:227-1471(-)
MDGIIAVRRDSGTLYFHRSFNANFGLQTDDTLKYCSNCGLRHQDEMNLGALLFALYTNSCGLFEEDADPDESPLKNIISGNLICKIRTTNCNGIDLIIIMFGSRHCEKELLGLSFMFEKSFSSVKIAGFRQLSWKSIRNRIYDGTSDLVKSVLSNIDTNLEFSALTIACLSGKKFMESLESRKSNSDIIHPSIPKPSKPNPVQQKTRLLRWLSPRRRRSNSPSKGISKEKDSTIPFVNASPAIPIDMLDSILKQRSYFSTEISRFANLVTGDDSRFLKNLLHTVRQSIGMGSRHKSDDLKGLQVVLKVDDVNSVNDETPPRNCSFDISITVLLSKSILLVIAFPDPDVCPVIPIDSIKLSNANELRSLELYCSLLDSIKAPTPLDEQTAHINDDSSSLPSPHTKKTSKRSNSVK